MKFKVGDRVRIDPGSQFYDRGLANPADVVGTVDTITSYMGEMG